MNKADELKKLHAKWLAECLCELRNTATQGVPGCGSANAHVVFIGEAPGAKEDKEGRPFVGAAGKFLDEMLASIKMKREDIYITNIVKYRPPNNRDPLPEEIAACSKWLAEEIQLIDPALIVFLGRHSMNHFFPNEKISEAHGKVLVAEKCGKPPHPSLHCCHVFSPSCLQKNTHSKKEGSSVEKRMQQKTLYKDGCRGKARHFLPLYHPAAALYNGSLREVLKKDFKKIPNILEKLKQANKKPE